VWLTLPRGEGFRSLRGGRVRQVVAAVPSHHVTTSGHGFRVTTLPRTAVDAARDLPLPETLVILDASLRAVCEGMVAGQLRRRDVANQRLVDAARLPLEEAMRWLPRTGGVRAGLALANPVRESPIESMSFGHMAMAGLPLPSCQFEVRLPGGSLFPDFYWEDANLIGESDGRLKYADSSAFAREKEREQLLRDLGFRIVRWLGKEIHLHPDRVMARIGRMLDA